MSVLQIATACLIDPHGRLLLVRKRGTLAFMLPGGKRETGESAWLERDRPYPDNLAPLLRDHVLPALQPLARLLSQDVHTVPTGQ